MAKKNAGKAVTKSDFLRKALGQDPELKLGEVNQHWANAGHSGKISSALYYKIRHELGLQVAWTWSPSESAESSSSQPLRSQVQTYQLKVTLRGIRPPIWRRLLVPDCSLEELHVIIQIAMGWEDDHLYDFEIGDGNYTDHRAAESDEECADLAKLSQVITRERLKFQYTYDFGDNWQHEILVEKILPPDQGPPFPICATGKRACPPENIRGPWGYYDLLEALEDPKTERHEELLEWLSDYEPEALDLEAINEELRQMES